MLEKEKLDFIPGKKKGFVKKRRIIEERKFMVENPKQSYILRKK